MSTASAIERLLACPASAVLPHVHQSSEDADRGSAIHGFIRGVLAGQPRGDCLANVPEAWRATCAGIDFAKLVGDISNVRAEVAYAVDVEEGLATTLGQNIGRKYPALGESFVCGTNDYEGQRFDGVEVAGDVKTGLQVTRTEHNPQAKFHALARYCATGAPEVEVRLSYIGWTGKVTHDSHVFTAFDLDEFMDELRELQAHIAAARLRYLTSGDVTVSSGDHCKYCPAMAACPAYTALARTMAADIADIEGRLEALTPYEQGVAWTKAKEVERLVERVLGGLKALAERDAIPLESGKVVKAITFEQHRFDADAALALLRELGATQAQVEDLYRASEVTQIRAVNGPRLMALGRKKKVA
jgi:hypothetical protein